MKHYIKYLLHLIVFTCAFGAKAGAYEDFFQAVGRDDGRTVSQLLARGFDPNSRDPQGQTALHLALRGDLPSVADALWASRALDVNVVNAHGESALMMAALRGKLDWAQRLLDRGAKVHLEGWSPIHYAATGSEPRVIAMLLEKGAPIDAVSPNRTTPLMMASRYGVEAGVDLLLARGADAKRRNDLNLTAVDFARQGGRDFLVDRLQKVSTR